MDLHTDLSTYVQYRCLKLKEIAWRLEKTLDDIAGMRPNKRCLNELGCVVKSNERFIIAPIYLNDTRFSKTQEYVFNCFSLSDGPEILKFITCDIDTYNTSRSGHVDKCIRELL